MSARRQTVAVIFGGRSVEHDVSIVTGHQVMRALDHSRYEAVPVYITRDGRWFTGDVLMDLENFKDDGLLHDKRLKAVILSPDIRHHGLIVHPLAGRFQKSEVIRLDVIFPTIHGSHGEDGTLQGLCELADIPCVGFQTTGSALTNDKILTRAVLMQYRIPVLEEVSFSRSTWLANPDAIVADIESTLMQYPVFVKPATLGSSIGVSRVTEAGMLRSSIDIAANFDRRVVVQRAVQGVEINCAVMGYGDDIQTSVLEQPVSWDEFLSYEDKYLRGNEGMKSADRIIPAPVDDELAERIRDYSVRAFKAVDGCGIARIDFLVEPDAGEVYLNELNTMPGSLAFYLWQESDLSPAEIVDRLITIAREVHAEKRRNVYDYRTSLITVAAGRGLKGSKQGSKPGDVAAGKKIKTTEQ